MTRENKTTQRHLTQAEQRTLDRALRRSVEVQSEATARHLTQAEQQTLDRALRRSVEVQSEATRSVAP
jgi:ribosomal protein S20